MWIFLHYGIEGGQQIKEHNFLYYINIMQQFRDCGVQVQ